MENGGAHRDAATDRNGRSRPLGVGRSMLDVRGSWRPAGGLGVTPRRHPGRARSPKPIATAGCYTTWTSPGPFAPCLRSSAVSKIAREQPGASDVWAEKPESIRCRPAGLPAESFITRYQSDQPKARLVIQATSGLFGPTLSGLDESGGNTAPLTKGGLVRGSSHFLCSMCPSPNTKFPPPPW